MRGGRLPSAALPPTAPDGSEGPPPLLDPELEDKFTVVVDGEAVVLDVTQQARELHKLTS